MIELKPLLQLKSINGEIKIHDVLSNDLFDVPTKDILPLLPIIADNTPSSAHDLSLIISNQGNISELEASDVVKNLLSCGLLDESQNIIAAKAGIQKWIDKGWIDALILHFSSRDLSYLDDPKDLDGNDDLSWLPKGIELQSSYSEKNEQYLYLKKPAENIQPEVILKGIIERRSFNAFKRNESTDSELANILWFANSYARDKSISLESNSDESDRKRVFDSAFSALSTYIIIYKTIDVSDGNILHPGIYLYDTRQHSLGLVKNGDFRKELSSIAAGQRRAGSGLMTFVLVGDWSAYSKRYPHERCYRNLLINTSQLAQYYLVLATINNFNTFMSPAIHDEKMYEFLNVSSGFPLYIVTAG